MNLRLLAAGACVAFLAMTAASTLAIRHVHAEAARDRDFADWPSVQGRLLRLELRETLYRRRWNYGVDCEYAFEAEGATHTGTRFAIDRRHFHDADEAKAYVERTLGIAGPANWRAAKSSTPSGWTLEASGLPVKVRHSPRDPTQAVLADTPPMGMLATWALIAVLGLLASATGAGALAMAWATFDPRLLEPTPPE